VDLLHPLDRVDGACQVVVEVVLRRRRWVALLDEACYHPADAEEGLQ